MILGISKKIFNDLHLAISFAILFTAYNGQTHIQQTVAVSIHEDNHEYSAKGFDTLGIIYIFFTFSTWLAPFFIAMIGCKMALAFGSLCYFTYVTFDYFENNWLTYASAAITGFGAASVWVGQGTYFVLNSEVGNMNTSICIFLLFLQASQFGGNLFIYFLFDNPDQPINRPMRTTIEVFLGVCVLSATILLAILPSPVKAKESGAVQTTLWNEIKKTFKTLLGEQMLQCFCIFIFYGLLVSFLDVLSASLSFSEYLSTNSKEYAPLSGLMQGCGEFIGIGLAWFMNSKAKYKFYLLPTACISSLIALSIVLLGLPDASVFKETRENPIIEMSLYIVLVANILLAMTDAILQAETYNIVGQMNLSDSAPSFAMANFIRNIASTASYFYSSYIGFHVQVLILIFFVASTFLVHCWMWRSICLRKFPIFNNEACKQKDQERYVKY